MGRRQPSSPCVFTRSALCACLCPNFRFVYKDASHIGLGLNPNDLILTELPLQRLYLQIQSHSEIPGGRALTHEFGGIQFGPQQLGLPEYIRKGKSRSRVKFPVVSRQHVAPSSQLVEKYSVLENAFCHLGLWASSPL